LERGWGRVWEGVCMEAQLSHAAFSRLFSNV
jgi:hypothetical protein